MKTERIYDVFLSYAPSDSGDASAVRRILESAGMAVFSPYDVAPGDRYGDKTRDALTLSTAVVVIVTGGARNSDNVLLEIGAASAGGLPVIPVLSGISADQLPVYLKHYVPVPIADSNALVERIKSLATPFSEDELEALNSIYQTVGVPADRLATEPLELLKFTRKFKSATRNDRSDMRILQELLRRRKQGKLPRLARRDPKGAA